MMDREELKELIDTYVNEFTANENTRIPIKVKDLKAVLTLLSKHEAYKKVVDAAENYVSIVDEYYKSAPDWSTAKKAFIPMQKSLDELND